jgi:hypothetical protein
MQDKPPELRGRLEEAHDLFSFIEDEFPALLDALERKRSAPRRKAR